MTTSPASEIFINKLTIFSQKRIRDNRESHQINRSGFRYNSHECFLILNNLINVINDECSIRELLTTEQCFEIRTVKDREVCKCTLVYSEIRLVQLMDDTLSFLISVVFWRYCIISVLYILLPEIIRVD